MRKSTQQLARSCGMHTIRRSKPVVKGYVSPMLSVPRSLSFPEYAETGEPIRNQR